MKPNCNSKSLNLRPALLLFVFLFSTHTPAAQAEVMPGFVDRQLSEVVLDAEELEIELIVEYMDSTKRKGMVLVQIPQSEAEIGTQRLVYVRISNGIRVPDLERVPQAEAEAKLGAIGLEFASSSRAVVGVEKGLVASQVPPEGTRIDATSEIVFLDVSSLKHATVPNLANKTLAQAIKELDRLGFKGTGDPPNPQLFFGGPCDPEYKYTTSVNSSSPRANKRVPVGTNVKLAYGLKLVHRFPGELCVDGVRR